jgi:hypothetical protein
MNNEMIVLVDCSQGPMGRFRVASSRADGQTGRRPVVTGPGKIDLTPKTRSLKRRARHMSHRPNHHVRCSLECGPAGAGSPLSKRGHFRAVQKPIGFVTTLWVLLFLTLANESPGQSVQADQRELVRSQSPSPFGPNVPPSGVADGRVVPTPNDSDLGEQQILKRVEEYEPFTVSVGAPFYWTSNVALTNSGEQSDFIVAPAAAVFYEPRIARTLFGLIGVREQLFYYDRFDGFDFGSFDFEIGLRYLLPQCHNLLLRVEYDYNRLTTKDSFDDFFSNHAIIASAEVPFRFGRAQQVSLGASANINAAGDPEPPRRNDYEVYAGYSANLSRALSVSAVGRFVVRDYYHQNSRVDVSEILALGANYRVTKFLTAGAVATFAASQSNHSVFDYEVANVGGVVSLWIKF